ncbi:MAG: hypothetical protein IT262_22920 [Saprospiraceae bacterium]|nr:hypothetical protein [Saprospiraceae bacterium]
MKKQIFAPLLLVAAIILTTFNACKKDNTGTTDPAVETSIQALRSQQLINSSFGIALHGAEKASGLMNQSAEERCSAVTIFPADATTFPKTITVDFGTGCTDSDGKFKTGKVVVTVDKIWEANTEVSILYDNYSEDGAQLSGRFTLKNQSNANAGIYTVTAEDIKAADTQGFTLDYDATQTFTQIGGHATWWDGNDDVYEITGSIKSVLTNDEIVEWTILNPLTKANNCLWISEGTGTLNINGLEVGVDYGSGTCDNKGTLTINGQTYEVTL